MLELKEVPEAVEQGSDDDELDHLFCIACYPEPDVYCISLCGEDVTAQEEGPDWGLRNPVCVVCDHLSKFACANCGQ